MSPEVVIAAVAVVSFIGGVVVWVDRAINKLLLELGITRSDVVKLQSETQQLRDSKVEHSTMLTAINSELAKTNVQLSKIDALIASVAALTAIVERLERDHV